MRIDERESTKGSWEERIQSKECEENEKQDGESLITLEIFHNLINTFDHYSRTYILTIICHN